MGVVAPIAVFAYRRPEHLERVLRSLNRNPLASQSDLVIFSDGARGSKDQAAVDAVRHVARRVQGFKSVKVVEAPANRGLARSLMSGVEYMLRVWDRVIVVEDDILVSTQFLQFMNEYLSVYQHDQRVASIHGYVYPIEQRGLDTTFFVKGADCWGWGTWRRAWSVFQPDGGRLRQELRDRGLMDAFNFEGTAPFEEMLIDQIEGRNDSGAVRWYASALVNDMLTLYPNQPMAINIGEDGSGTHRGSSSAYHQQLSQSPVTVERIPIVESEEGREAFREFFRARYRIPSNKFGRWVWRRARRVRNRLRH